MAWGNDLPDFNKAYLKPLNRLSKYLQYFPVTVHSFGMGCKLANKVTTLITELLKISAASQTSIELNTGSSKFFSC